MRTYYEATELTPPPGEEAEFVRVDVANLSPAERLTVAASIEGIMAGRAYVAKTHHCRHDEYGLCEALGGWL